MFRRAVSVIRHSNLRGAVTKATENLKSAKNDAPELASLPPAPHLRSLQYIGAKRGSIKPILHNEPIKLGARVDPTHPVLSNKRFNPLSSLHEFFDVRAYPNAMLKRLGVVIKPGGKILPRPPKEPDFPILKSKKRAKFPSAFVMPIKKTHKNSVVRTRLKRKLAEAIKLVVTRGADADEGEKKVIFKQSEAGEAKWLLRDWYYVVNPKPPIYYASWPDLIKATRSVLSNIVDKGTEYNSTWSLQVAERESDATTRLARREMRRARMWRRQEQEVLAKGEIAEDVGIRRKEKGMSVKKRRIGKGNSARSEGGAGRMKVIKASNRGVLQNGDSIGRRSPAKARPKPHTESAEPDSKSTTLRRHKTPNLVSVTPFTTSVSLNNSQDRGHKNSPKQISASSNPTSQNERATPSTQSPSPVLATSKSNVPRRLTSRLPKRKD